jgi:hypothetical protein
MMPIVILNNVEVAYPFLGDIRYFQYTIALQQRSEIKLKLGLQLGD